MAISSTCSGEITIITIDRPEVRNAVDRPTADALAAAFRAFEGDDSQRVAILTGANGVFCAGADLQAMGSDRANRVAADMAVDGPMGPSRMSLTKPVIAAVEGYAVAGGLELAVWCDLRVAAEDATFGVFCRRWGVPLIDGGTVRLPRLIGHGRAMDMILTGRAVEADEALRIGLVDRVVPSGTALEAATELATLIAGHPQTCALSDRASAIASWDLPFDEAMAFETAAGRAILTGPEIAAGVGRFVSGDGRHGASRSG